MTTAELKRLFVAAWPGEELRSEITGALEALRATEAPARWVPPENAHVTLRFLGNVESDRVPELVRALDAALGESTPPPRPAVFPWRLGGLGTFPGQGTPRVIWAGLDRGAGELASLASVVERALVPAGFRAGTDRPFRAHVTLGRWKGSRRPGCRSREVRGLERLRALLAQWTPPGRLHSLTEVRLVESRLESRGAVYAPVARFPLHDPRGEPRRSG